MNWYHEASQDDGLWHRQFHKRGKSTIPNMLDNEVEEYIQNKTPMQSLPKREQIAHNFMLGRIYDRPDDPDYDEIRQFDREQAQKHREKLERRVPYALKMFKKFQSKITPKDINGELKSEDYPNGKLPPMLHYIENDILQPKKDIREIHHKYWHMVGNSMFEDMGKGNELSDQEQRDAVAEGMKKSTPSVQIPFTAFRKFLNDGVIKNIHQTNKSAAQDQWYTKSEKNKYLEDRKRAEYNQFGLMNREMDKAPIYGYMDDDESQTKDYDKSNPEDCKEILKKIYERSISFSGFKFDHAKKFNKQIDENPDSMYIVVDSNGEGDEYGYPDSRSIMSASQIVDDHLSYHNDKYKNPIEKNRFFPIGDGNGNLDFDQCKTQAQRKPVNVESYYGEVKLRFKRHVLDNATVCADDSTNSALNGTSVVMPARMVENADPRLPVLTGIGTYVSKCGAAGHEVQYHKHPTLDDVEHIEFMGCKLPTKPMQKVLAEKNIEWSHASPLPQREHTLDQVYQQAGIKRTI